MATGKIARPAGAVLSVLFGLFACLTDMLAADLEHYRPAMVTLGVAQTASAVASTTWIGNELGLDREVSGKLLAIALRRHSDSKQLVQIREKYQHWASHWKMESYFQKGFVAESQLVESFNATVLEEIDSILDDEKRSARFRELYTQQLIQALDFDTVFRLNEITPKLDEYRALHLALSANEKTSRPGSMFAQQRASLFEQQYLYEAAIRHVLGGWLPDADRAKTLSVYLLPSNHAGELGAAFDDAPWRLIATPAIQLELKLTAAQARKCSLSAAKSVRAISEDVAFELEASLSEEDYAKRVKDFHEKMMQEISGLLDPAQMETLRLLLFQYFLVHEHPRLAMAAVGKDYDKSKRPWDIWYDVQTEAKYNQFVDSLKSGMQALAASVGKRKVRHICGKLVLPRALPGSNKESEQRLDRIHDRLTRRLQAEVYSVGFGRRRNIRRESDN